MRKDRGVDYRLSQEFLFTACPPVGVRKYEVDIPFDAFPDFLPHGLTFMDESLGRIEQVADEIREDILESFSRG